MNRAIKELGKRIISLIPDRMWLSCLFRRKMGYSMDWKNPSTYSQKLQWLKVYDRKPLYTKLVDKYEVKEYVAKLIGDEYIIPTLGIWNRFEDVNFDALPDQFVLKCTHDSGGLIICRDKNSFDKEKAREMFRVAMKRNPYSVTREWPYKNVKPRIIAETYMEEHGDESSIKGLVDYKFYCFNGQPRFLYVSKGLENHATARISFLTLDWKIAPYQRIDYATFEELPKQPVTYVKMLNLCKALSANIPFVRVDLYEINGRAYFSELTFSPCSGLMPFCNPEHDLDIGRMLDLPIS